MKTAIITGITGQDGSYLSELLISKGYCVHGIIRRSSEFNTSRINHLYDDPKLKSQFYLHYGDLTDSSSIFSLINSIHPDEIYNLGAQSHVKVSFEVPEFTANVDALGALRILEAIRQLNPKTRFYQASSSEMFGKVQEVPQTEKTPFYPRSPYGCSKLFAYWTTINYRESYGIYACNGILFNHESERRGKTFVTRKITRGLARIKLGIDETLILGNLESKRDWGHAQDYVMAMWQILNHTKPDDYVISTNEMHTVREFVEKAGKYFGMDIVWKGNSFNEIGIDRNTNKIIIRVSEKYFRPAEVEQLQGNPNKAKKVLGWSPKVGFDSLVERMCEYDYTQEKHANR